MWDTKKYEKEKAKCKSNIDSKRKSPYDYMLIYKEMVEVENYEACKAITEILKPLNYETIDTHAHIPSLNGG